jgi:2-oxoglutarate ferredoxin oxidoreductase subunit delta
MQKVVVARDICKGCQLCTSACPKGLLAVSKTINKNGYLPVYCTDESQCTSCAMCAVNCPDVAIEVFKE